MSEAHNLSEDSDIVVQPKEKASQDKKGKGKKSVTRNDSNLAWLCGSSD